MPINCGTPVSRPSGKRGGRRGACPGNLPVWVGWGVGEDPLPDLSICMATAAAPERVAGALRPLLETLTVEAEVVIGLDDRLDRALEPAYGVVLAA